MAHYHTDTYKVYTLHFVFINILESWVVTQKPRPCLPEPSIVCFQECFFPIPVYIFFSVRLWMFLKVDRIECHCLLISIHACITIWVPICRYSPRILYSTPFSLRFGLQTTPVIFRYFSIFERRKNYKYCQRKYIFYFVRDTRSRKTWETCAFSKYYIESLVIYTGFIHAILFRFNLLHPHFTFSHFPTILAEQLNPFLQRLCDERELSIVRRHPDLSAEDPLHPTFY